MQLLDLPGGQRATDLPQQRGDERAAAHPDLSSAVTPAGVPRPDPAHVRTHPAGDHKPSHCSAPPASNRSTSTKPGLAARRIEPTFAVRVVSTTGSPGTAAASQPRAAAHPSAAQGA